MHVSMETILATMQIAVKEKTKAASRLFVPPSNSRAYACMVDGCVRPADAKGYCNAHYLRHRSGMLLDTPVRARKRDDLCEQCGNLPGAKGGWGLCQRHYRQARYEVLKDAVVSLFGGKCARCCNSYHRAVFDFHHLGDKTGSPSEMLSNKSLQQIARELSKCTMLCANCHRLEHHNDV